MDTDMLSRLFEHLAWADALARDEVVGMAAGSPERRRATEIYAHLAAAEHTWLARLTNQPAAHALWPALELDAAASLATETAQGFRAFIASLGADGGGATVVYRNSSGAEFRNRVDDVLGHVALHGSYHRGQLALLARMSGGAPRLSDYIAFLRLPAGG
jgi:uncharacterized damage-inducible protein DinB